MKNMPGLALKALEQQRFQQILPLSMDPMPVLHIQKEMQLDEDEMIDIVNYIFPVVWFIWKGHKYENFLVIKSVMLAVQ